MSDWNEKVIEEFRANEGRVSGPFEGAPMILVHHVGRKSGKRTVTPMMHLQDESDPGTLYVFASMGGAPKHPAWFHNITANPEVTLEVGTEKFSARASVAEGGERDRLYAQQAAEMPAFNEYQEKTTRRIPVVVLQRQA